MPRSEEVGQSSSREDGSFLQSSESPALIVKATATLTWTTFTGKLGGPVTIAQMRSHFTPLIRAACCTLICGTLEVLGAYSSNKIILPKCC